MIWDIVKNSWNWFHVKVGAHLKAFTDDDFKHSTGARDLLLTRLHEKYGAPSVNLRMHDFERG